MSATILDAFEYAISQGYAGTQAEFTALMSLALKYEKTIRKDLGRVTAYGYAKSKGYTGTEEEFAELMASYATVAEEAATSADQASGYALVSQDWSKNSEAWATGKKNGVDVDSEDVAYHNNSKYYAEQAQDSADAAAESAATFTTDTGLTIAGKAADAKATGDRLAGIAAAVGSPLVITDPDDFDNASHTRVYVYAGTTTSLYTNGDWYYWDGDGWESGGVYNSVALDTDETLSVAGAAADAAAVGEVVDDVTDLKSAIKLAGVEAINPTGTGYYINTGIGASASFGTSTGSVISTQLNVSTGGMSYFIVDCESGDEFTISGTGGTSGRLWAFVDDNYIVTNASTANATANNIVLKAPYESSKLIVNFYPGGSLYKGRVTTKQLDDIKDNVDGSITVSDSKQLVAGYTDRTRYVVSDTMYFSPMMRYMESYIGQVYTNYFTTVEGSRILKIPCNGFDTITYTTFKSTSNLGGAFIDKDDKIISGYVETVTAGTKTLSIPDNAKYFIMSLAPTIFDSASVSLIRNNLLKNEVELIEGKKIYKDSAVSKYNIINNGAIYRIYNLIIGTTTISEIESFGSTGAYSLIIPLDGIKRISYPVFKSTSGGMSFICDENDVVIWAYSESDAMNNSQKVVVIPDNASYFVLTVSNSLDQYDWSVTLSSLNLLFENNESAHNVPFSDVNRNMCLAGIKTDILTNKIPYHRGFLFHKLQNNDNSLWYGTDFGKIERIGSVTYNPTLMRFAISPKDGRIIAVQRDVRNGIWIWNGTEEIHLDGFTSNPQAWLYNSGVDFIVDSNNVEHCVFAEYTSSPSSSLTLNVWRGTYPYTSQSDWEIVLSQTSVTDIGHFHMVRRDPWTNVLYCTSGDSDPQSKWWYSTDAGATWTLLISGSSTGWNSQICRTINFIFTEDYVYWAIDHGQNTHALYKIQRNELTGIIDPSTKEKIIDLPGLRATNSLCYVESPNGLFMYDRIDTEPTSEFGKPVTMKFWSFETEELIDIVTLNLTSSTWGGSRGKCYINYTNSKQPMPAMGFSIDTPCIFDIVCDNPSNIGTIAYDVGSKTIHTIDY